MKKPNRNEIAKREFNKLYSELTDMEKYFIDDAFCYLMAEYYEKN